MAMKNWVLELFEQLCDSESWMSYDDPNVLTNIENVSSHWRVTFLSLIYNEEHYELYFLWDPQLQISSNVRTLYEQTITSLNNHIDEFEGGFGQFRINESGGILFSVSLTPMFEELYPTAAEDINDFADRIYGMCSNMYLALLEVESGRDMEQVLMLACSHVAGHA